MPTAEQIRAVAAKHVDKKTRPNAYEELAKDIAAMFGMKLEEEPFRLTAENNAGSIIPPRIDSPKFREYWAKWIADRKKARRSVSPETLAHHLELLNECDPDQAAECLKVAAYAGHMTIYNRGFKSNGRANSGGSVARTIEEAAKRNRDGVL